MTNNLSIKGSLFYGKNCVVCLDCFQDVHLDCVTIQLRYFIKMLPGISKVYIQAIVEAIKFFE